MSQARTDEPDQESDQQAANESEAIEPGMVVETTQGDLGDLMAIGSGLELVTGVRWVWFGLKNATADATRVARGKRQMPADPDVTF